MIPVDQSEIGRDNPRANCLMACVASILEVSINSLPDAHEAEKNGKHWYSLLTDVLAQHGFRPVEGGSRDDFHIAVGQSPRSDNHHAVVFRGSELVHDPHPTRGGIVGTPSYWITFERIP